LGWDVLGIYVVGVLLSLIIRMGLFLIAIMAFCCAGRNLHVCGFTGSIENEEANSNCAPLCEGHSGKTLPYSKRTWRIRFTCESDRLGCKYSVFQPNHGLLPCLSCWNTVLCV
jgi:hypothetical protein